MSAHHRYISMQGCQGITMKMLENSHLPTSIHKSIYSPCNYILRHAEPTFMPKAQKCPIYLGIHTYNTFKSAFTVITTPIAKLLHCCLLQLYTCYAIFVYCKIILYTGGCAIIRNFYVIFADEFCSCLIKRINLHHIIIAYNDLISFNSVHTCHSHPLRGPYKLYLPGRVMGYIHCSDRKRLNNLPDKKGTKLH